MTLKELGIAIDDTTPLDVAIEKLETLRGKLVEVGTASEKNARSYGAALTAINKGAVDLDKNLGTLDATLKENQTLIAANAASANKLLESHNLNKKAFDDETKAAADFGEMSKRLQKAQEDLAKANIKGAGTIGELKKQLVDASKVAKNAGTASDAIVSADAIKKVETLSKSVATAENAVSSSNKVIAAAAAFYDKLKAGVAAAGERIRAFAGGIGSNTEAFKNLKKGAEEGTDKIRKYEEGLDKAGEKSEHTAEALDRLDEATGGAIGKGKEFVGVLKLIALSPVGAIVLAIALAFEALNEFFNGSIEGQDEFNKVLLQGQAILETFKSFLEKFGKILFETLSKPGKILDEVVAKLSEFSAAFVDAFTHPIDTIKALGQAILDNVVSRFKAIAVGAEAIQKIIGGDFAGGLKKFADAQIQLLTGITDGTDKIKAVYDDLSDAAKKAADEFQKELARRQALNAKFAALENQLKKDRIADIVDDAKTELLVYRELNKAQDKLRYSANQRFEAEKKAGALLEDQLRGDIKLAEDEIALQELQIQRTGETYESAQKLAELQAARIGLESAFEKALKKRQATERALLEEAEKDRLDTIKREAAAEKALNDAITKGRIDANKETIADDRTTFEERDRLLIENADAQKSLLETANQEKLDAAKEEAIGRVAVNQDALDKILSNDKLNAEQINAQRRALSEEAIKTDETYLNNVAALNEQLAQGIEQVNHDTINAVAENVFKKLEQDYHHLLDSIDEQAATEALGLNKALEDGNINYKKYAEARQLIQDQAQQDALKSQISYLEQTIANLAAAGHDTSDLDAQLAQVKLQLSDATNAKLIEGQAKLQEGLKQLQQAGFDAATAVFNNLADAADADRQAKLDALTTQYENETTLAGDNDAKKLELQNAYNLQKEKIDKEQRAADRKRAIFQKTLALVEIAINTAKGIGLALGTYPPPVSFALAAVTAVLGALQVAAVLSKPIPSFAEGTDSAPGGLSIVNDGTGPELVVGKQGARMYDTPGAALVSLDKGDKVYTAEETAKILRDGDQMIAGFDDETQRLKFIKRENDIDLMTNALGGKLDQLIDATRRNKPAKGDTEGMANALARALALHDYEANEYR